MASSLENLRREIGAAILPYLKSYADRVLRARLDAKLFRDPIFGFQKLFPHETLVIDSPLFQRLRGIHQTSVTYFTYPSAIHTRFEHSVNCVYLAGRVIESLRVQGTSIDDWEAAEIRLAALLHDIGHCVFSHGSEFFYRAFQEVQSACRDEVFRGGRPAEGEVVNYCIITSPEFRELLWEPITRRCQVTANYLQKVQLDRVAGMVAGLPAESHRQFQTDIVNGALDVDKLDYLTRDSYFTGVSLSVDIERLLPSLRVTEHDNPELGRKESRLAVDHRGIAVVEQLLFARMLLYDTVYHHHKVRAANAALQKILRAHHDRKVWNSSSGKLNSIRDLLDIDEYEFFGTNYDDPRIRDDIRNLRYRDLPVRAIVLAPRTLVDESSHTTWSTWHAEARDRDPLSQEKSERFFRNIRDDILGYCVEEGIASLQEEDIVIDIPDPPQYDRLGQNTLIQIVEGYAVELSHFFPFQKAVNNYSEQYKYRSYVFAPEPFQEVVAYAAFRAFGNAGIHLNDLALILSHQDQGLTHDLLVKNHVAIPDWRTEFYIPPPS